MLCALYLALLSLSLISEVFFDDPHFPTYLVSIYILVSPQFFVGKKRKKDTVISLLRHGHTDINRRLLIIEKHHAGILVMKIKPNLIDSFQTTKEVRIKILGHIPFCKTE